MNRREAIVSGAAALLGAFGVAPAAASPELVAGDCDMVCVLLADHVSRNGLTVPESVVLEALPRLGGCPVELGQGSGAVIGYVARWEYIYGWLMAELVVAREHHVALGAGKLVCRPCVLMTDEAGTATRIETVLRVYLAEPSKESWLPNRTTSSP